MDSINPQHRTISGCAALSAGLFVVLTLDPRAMSEPFKDASLDARCLELEAKQYLAIVGFGPLKIGDSAPLFEFHLVSQGLAKIMPGLGVNSAMCIPILPEDDHPTTRKALQTTGGSLRLKNCYYHSHNSTLLLSISGVDNSGESGTYLSSDELCRLDEIGAGDKAQSSAVRSTLKPRTDASTLYQRPLSPFHDTVLPVPIVPSRTQKASISRNTSSIDVLVPEGTIDAHPALAPAPWVRVNPTSSSCGSGLSSYDFQLPTNENRDGHPFQATVKVSLNLDGLKGASLPSSTDFLEEIRLVHDLFVEHCQSSYSAPSISPAKYAKLRYLCLFIFHGIRSSRLVLTRSYNRLKKRVTAIPVFRKVVPSVPETLSNVCRHFQKVVGGSVLQGP